MKTKKENILTYLIPLGVGIVLIVCGLIWSKFYLLAIGTTTSFFSLVNVIYSCFADPEKDDFPMGAGCGCVIVIAVISFLALAYSDTRYISPNGSKQHLYQDCSSLSHSKNVKEVSELEGFFHLCFSDCKNCVKRHDEERKLKREYRKQQEREEKIQELQEKIDALRNGADVEDVEDPVSEDEDDDYIPGVPSRYQ